MNYKIDKELVRDSYSRMPDYELTRIATSDANGLTHEAQQILIDEVRKRGLSESLINSVASQNAILTQEDIDELCMLIQSLPCPVCGDNSSKLNAIITAEVMSVILFTHYEKKIKVACGSCLSSINTNALLKSTALGWWGIPWGIVRTLQAISIGIANKKQINSTESSDALKAFAIANRGAIEAYKEDFSQLKVVLLK